MPVLSVLFGTRTDYDPHVTDWLADASSPDIARRQAGAERLRRVVRQRWRYGEWDRRLAATVLAVLDAHPAEE